MSDTETPYTPEATLRFLITAWGVVLAVLYGLSAAAPSGINWGFHAFGLYPFPIAALAVVLILLLCRPAVQDTLLAALTRMLEQSSPRPPVLVYSLVAVLVVISGVVFYQFRVHAPLYGDGLLLGNVLPDIADLTKSPVSKVEPFSLYLVIVTWKLLGALHISPDPLVAYRLLSMLAGMGAVVVGWFLVRQLAEATLDRLLLYVLLLGSGMAQLFFCHVENYSVFALGIILFFTAALRYLRGGLPLVVPSVSFGVVFTLQFGAICMLPALLYLMAHEGARRNYRMVALSAAAMPVTVAAILALCGYTPGAFMTAFGGNAGKILPFFGWRGTTYPIFSWQHGLDLLNLFTFIQPFTFTFAVTALPFLFSRRAGLFHKIESRALFLLLAGTGAAVLLLAMHFELGMSRDWDAAAPFAWMVATGLLGLIAEAGRKDTASWRRLSVLMAGVTLISTAGWVGINADRSRLVERVRLLPDERLWDRPAYHFYDDAMFTYYQKIGDSRAAAQCYEDHIKDDSLNVRYWVGLSLMYHDINAFDKERRAYEKIVALGGKFQNVYENLSSMYVIDDSLDAASALHKKGLELFPGSAQLYNNEGVVLMNRDGDWTKALEHFGQAIHLDPRFSKAYYNAGFCSQQLGDTERMRLFYQQFLMMEPFNPAVREIREALAASAPGSKPAM